ncbi:substrate-binding domain-containing protein [Streptomyces sp. DSM 40750]|uniref:substrate-binding domain-containing protein n=1 Tax=Streptomyces sp. DSM 40750 TaxID=2801030 RepID=UPI00214AD5FE|nr:substrate-binding domain-containing protein [Streptomyces sp. DSM 40750]UUU23286.1 substrate-binding domain-containing protein [Streptomyces sp. DSM 40750]
MFETIADFFGGLSNGQMWAGALVCALSASLGAYWLDKYQGWRRISWSEVYNGPINKHINNQPPPGMWEIHWQGRQISEGSLVILEVRNSGVQPLEPEHFVAPLTFRFEGKKVVHFKVRDAHEPLESALRPFVRAAIQPEPADGDDARQPAPEPTDTITLPLFTLNRGEHFRLLVLVEDDGTGTTNKPKITHTGKLRGGRIKWSFGRARRRLATAIVILLVASFSVGTGVYANNRSLALNATCSPGTLTLTGSTAFSPLAHQVKEVYEERCPGTRVELRPSSSEEGLRALAEHPADETIAMVDSVAGQKPEQGYDAHHVGVLVFAVVANESLGTDLTNGESLWDKGLSQEQLRQIFSGGTLGDTEGRLTSAPVAVIRSNGSGTRNVFEDRVLGPVTAPPSADACPRPAPGQEGADNENPPRICWVRSTLELLDYVNRTPNAIGYAEADALPFFPNVRTVPINSTAPTHENVLNGNYKFWASEVLYTQPGATGLPRNFLDFLRSRGVSKLLEGQGFLPCREVEDSRDTAMRC